MPTTPERRLRDLHAAHGRAVLAFAVRRTTDAQDAADVVAETFLVAWRRLDDVPAGDEARLWLYGVARNTLANHHRAQRRRDRLAERLRADLPAALAFAPAPADPEAAAVTEALSRLADDDREILVLAAWEELEPVEIAQVLGISRVAARSRLHRARRRLREQLAEPVLASLEELR